MGGRGAGERERQLWLGGGTYITEKDFESAIPLDQYTAIGEVTPSHGRPLTYGGAGKAVNAGLSSAKAGVNLSKGDSIKVAHGLLTTGALLGKSGNLRTRLYTAARLIGNYEALTKGNKAIVRRFARVMTGRITGKTFRKLFK